MFFSAKKRYQKKGVITVENYNISDEELLKHIKENNIIDLSSIQQEIEMKKNAEYLKMHPYKIWKCSSDGRWYTRIEGGKKKKFKKREDLDNFLIEYYKDKENTRTIEQVFEEWLETKATNKNKKIKPQTLTRYRSRVKRFLTTNPYAEFILFIPFEDITEDDLERMIYDTVENQSIDSKEFHEFLSHMQHMFQFAKHKKYTKESYLEFFSDLDIDTMDLTRIKHSKDELTFTQEEEVALVTKMLELADIRSLGLVILFDTGIRVSELSALRKADVKGDCVHIHATEVNYKDPVTNKNVVTVQNATKTDAGVRDVYLSELGVKVMTAIMAMSGDSEWVFSENGKRIKSHAFRKKLYNICDLIHIKRRSPHKIRKAYATKLIYAGISENIVKELMGHTDIATTRKSYCIDSTTPEEFRNAVRQISAKTGLGTKLFPIGTNQEMLKPCV